MKEKALLVVSNVIESFGNYITEERTIAERLAFLIESDENIEAEGFIEAVADLGLLGRSDYEVLKGWVNEN